MNVLRNSLNSKGFPESRFWARKRRITFLITNIIVAISKTTDRISCQFGTTVADNLEIIDIGAVSGKMLNKTKSNALGEEITKLLKNSGMINGKITINVAWLPSFGLGTSAPSPAIRLLYNM